MKTYKLCITIKDKKEFSCWLPSEDAILDKSITLGKDSGWVISEIGIEKPESVVKKDPR